MQLWKWALLFLAVVSASAQTGILKIDPPCPVLPMLDDPGTLAITIRYSPGALLKDSQKLTLEMGKNDGYFPHNTDSLSMVRQANGDWEAILKPTPKKLLAFYLIFQVRDDVSGKIDTNNGDYWDVVFCNPKNGYLFQGVQFQAETYTGYTFENGIARKEDLGKAMAILKEFIGTPGTNHYFLLSEYWDLQIKSKKNKESAWQELSDEIRNFTQEHRGDKSALASAFNFVQVNTDHLSPDIFPLLLGDIDTLDHAMSQRLERMAAYNMIQQEKDSYRLADGLQSFIHKYPDDPNILYAVTEYFSLLRDFKDVPRAEAFFTEFIPHRSEWADLYASMASIYIDNNQKLDRALQLLDHAEQLGEAGIRPLPRSSPSYNVLSPDLEQSKAALAYWHARAYLAQNHGDLALPMALKAAERQHNSERVFLLAQAYEATGDKQKAADAYLEALSLPSIYATEEREKLSHLWVTANLGTKEVLEQKLRDKQAEAFRKTNYIPHLIDRPVPAYEFTTLKKEKFKSADLNDRIVVLNFWGVWCLPCLPELPGFQELQKKHPEIVVAAVAVSSDLGKIQSLIAKAKLDSLRIAQNDDLEESFVPSSVPVTYIIDHGRIRIIHPEAISDVVAYIEADLAALKTDHVKQAATVSN